jgi:hypothetical protein
MELAWRLYEKRRSKKTMIKNVAGHVMSQK